MKRNCPLSVAFILALASSCSHALQNGPDGPPYSQNQVSHDEIVLGERLEDPYSLENIRSAYVSLYPTKAREDIQPTDCYVRFLPRDEEQFARLRSAGLQMLDHPMDYEIVREGDYYHDPSLGEEDITWQYTVVPADFTFPDDIRYEILHNCYIREDSPLAKSSSDIDWSAVEAESFRITGNGALLQNGLKGGPGGEASARPSGRITITDPKANGGQPVGVEGVTVSCNVFVKFASAYTDRDGYYTIPKTFSAAPRYRLVFKNKKGFSIGFNTVLYPASISSLGTNPMEGVSINVNENSERKLFRRCVVNNAASEFYARCDIGDLNLPGPPSDLCFWMFDIFDASSAVMLHHGTLLDRNSSNTIFKIVSWVVCLFGPDITLGTSLCNSYQEIYSQVCHEMAHACHFRQTGVDYWNEYIKYIVFSALMGQDMYGDGTAEGSGYCAVGEMWAYYLQSKMYKERYGGANPAFGTSQWFHPQILTGVEDRGLSASDIFAALTSSVRSKDALRDRLGEMYPSKKTSIDQIFNRYD